MALSVNIKISQKLILTALYKQSLHILRMPAEEMAEWLKEEAVGNPLLELRLGKLGSPRKQQKAGPYSNDWLLDSVSNDERSLEFVLVEQLYDRAIGANLHNICLFVIRSLDEKGYLQLPHRFIAEHLKVPLRDVMEAVRIVQGLEPYGVAAASLEECLLLQVEHQEDADPLVRRLINEDLADIAKGRLTALAGKYAVPPSDILRALNRLRQLDPKPGALYMREKTQYILPDLLLQYNNGEHKVSIHEPAFPSVSLNREYDELLNRTNQKETSDFLGKQSARAKQIIESVQYRKATLLHVASVIFEKQHKFCLEGPSAIRPMVLRDVAEPAGLHESTVSRAVNHKYISTAWGLFELKHFFSQSLIQIGGDEVSAVQVKERIRDILKEENKAIPLSDQKIADLLQQSGVIISRRTVTKYREQMAIGSAMERRHYF